MNNTIEHTNIIYMPTISALGGIETYVYELVKKYKDLDIAVVSKNCDEKQAERIRKYCRLYIHNGQKIKCKVAVINYDQSIIDYINEDAEIYQTIHADYSNKIYDGRRPKAHPRVKEYIAITKYLLPKMKEILQVDNVRLSYNPLTVEDETKPIIIVSATRLHQNKGKDRIITFTKEMERQNKSYLLFILTGDIDTIGNPNVIFIKNRLDIGRWLKLADYVLLFSDSEACSYTLNEALYRNIPILCTPLPYLKEIGVEDGKNAYILDFDCSNVKELVSKIDNIPKFTFNKLEDDYKNIFKKSKSKYQDYLKTKARCKCIIDRGYYDLELQRNFKYDEELPLIHIDRAKHLEKLKLVEILEVLNE